MTHDDPRMTELVRDVATVRISRRELGRRAAALGLSVPAAKALAGSTAGVAATMPAVASLAAAQEGSGGTLNFATTQGDFGIGNPILVNGTSLPNWWFTHSRLVKYDDRGNVVPDLADTWEYNEDGTELTFHLNPNARWHDGEPVTSADVLFTFDTIVDEATDTDQRGRLQVADTYVTWDAPDPETVVITLPEPLAPFLFALSQIGIIPQHVLADSADINTDPYNTAPIGSGAFRVIEWQVGQYTRMEAFEDYHHGRPAADFLNVVLFEDTAPAYASLETGEVDFVFTPPESQERYEDHPDFMLLRYVYFTPITLSFNLRNEILQDIRVREAIRYAIDKDTLAEIVTRGRDPRADNQYSDGGPLDRYNDYSLPPDEFDLEQANALLDEAGWVLGDDGIREQDGQRLSFPMLTYSGFEEYQNGLEILQDMLGQVGIETRPEIISYSALSARWADPDDDPTTRPMTLEEYPHPFEQDPDVFNELHSVSIPPAGNNYNYVADDEIDRLIEAGRTEVDDEVRIGIYHQLDARRKELIASIPLYLATDAWTVSRMVGGVPEDTPSFRWYHRCCADKMYKIEG